MVYAPGAGRGPLPIPVAVLFLLVGPLLVWFAYQAATTEPRPTILSCTREAADVIACEPGNVRGARAAARRQSGKNAKTCFTLGDAWMTCGGDVQGAVERVNALAIGATAEVDLTREKDGIYTVVSMAAFGLLMIVLGARRLFGNIRKPSSS